LRARLDRFKESPFEHAARYARRVNTLVNTKERLLLIDTCGETAGVALSEGLQVLACEELARGSASAEIVSAVRRLLEQVGWRLAELSAVGVVNGPGSFTGMRAGLATAKGLCEAAGLAMAVVSRLEVLADAASLQQGIVALDAGRGELYVRDIEAGRERLCSSDDMAGVCDGRPLVVAETRIAERLAMYEPALYPLHVGDALRVVIRRLKEGGSDVSLVDANYVREESDLYRKPKDVVKDPLAGAR
jgi:tRNA threonylcarbamoyladenosine biosynthesis protein TsaB